MGHSYSLDLRERIVEREGQCHSRRDAAQYFGVSSGCAIKLLRRANASGSVEPTKQGRPPGQGKLAPHRDFLIGRVKDKPASPCPNSRPN